MLDHNRLTQVDVTWIGAFFVLIIYFGMLLSGSQKVDYLESGEYYKARLYNSYELVYKTEENCYFAIGDDTCYYPEMDGVEILYKVKFVRSR